jgi:hypothetical protein
MVGDSFYAVIDLQSRYPRLANVFWGLFTLALFFFLITNLAKCVRPG